MSVRPAVARDPSRRHLPVAPAELHGRADLASGVRLSDPPQSRGCHPCAAPYPLGPRALRALRALIVALCPSAPAPQPLDMVERVERGARHFMAYMHPMVGRMLTLCVLLLEHLPLLFGRKRLSALGVEHARGFLHRIAYSRIPLLRTLLAGVRGLVLSVYFDQDEVHQALGYAPLPFIEERVALRRRRLLASGAAK